MDAKTFSRRNLDFTLFEVLHLTDLTRHAHFSAHDRETFGLTLDMASEIASRIMRPAYEASDRQPPVLENGQVKVHPAVQEYYTSYSETGLLAAVFPQEWGGQQLPKTLAAASEFMLGSAHNAFIMYSDLSKGAANLILKFGTDAQKKFFLPPMLSGHWTGTMCLTEPQAGSSLSDISTAAYPQPDGTYKIVGQKIFISAGDQHFSENIVHLVLARIEGAPKGTKGISLFIVPKKRLNSEGMTLSHPDTTLSDNDVTSVAIYHKMGQKATPAMHLEFGANNDCTGYLLGEAHRGLPQMFLMMNGARLGVGMGGIHIASAAYCASLQYAHERPQGRRLNEKSALGEPVPIIQHPDVRRMLLLQKSIVEGGLCLILHCYKYLDLETVTDDSSEKKHYSDLLELLTPVAKTYGAEMGFFSVNQGLQVLGGYGYTEDFVLEQLARDVRIMPLYEGTTGIQAQALLGRQVFGNGGRSLAAWYFEVTKDVFDAQEMPTLKPYWNKLITAMRLFQKVTGRLLKTAKKGDQEIFLADASLYLEAFGLLNVAWQWLRQAIVAQQVLDKGQALGEDAVFYLSKIHTMQFYFHYELPRLKGLMTRLSNPVVLTVFDQHIEVIV